MPWGDFARAQADLAKAKALKQGATATPAQREQ